MNFDINKLVNNVSKVTLKGGIFSKTCTVIIVVSIILGVTAYWSKDIWITRIVIAMIFALTFTMLSKLISFANKNPQAAILEGAEFLVHEQMQLAAKGIPVIPLFAKNNTEDKSVNISAEDIRKSSEPDERFLDKEVKDGKEG